VDAFIAKAKPLKPRVLYVEFRAVDSAMSGKNGRPEMRGALYFKPSCKIEHIKVYKTMAPYNEDFSDPKYLNYIIEQAHAAGMRVHAWFPTFNDRPLWQADPDFKVLPLSRADPDGETFVSPANPKVRAHEKDLIECILHDFKVDGITLDWIRYTQENQPQDKSAAAQYQALYQSEISGPANGGKSHPEWQRYLDFRAELLASFFREAKAVCDSKGVELGAFVMPHTAKVGKEDAAGGDWGYAYEPWSGVDFMKLRNVGAQLMPMIYWDEKLGWGSPWKGWKRFTEKVSQNMQAWMSGAASSYVPCYSAAYPLDELLEGFKLARRQGVRSVVVFYYGEWDKPWPATDKLDKLQTLGEVLKRLNGGL
jgi:uncharacterized lipoprotein YddW (UPF0748 family)